MRQPAFSALDWFNAEIGNFLYFCTTPPSTVEKTDRCKKSARAFIRILSFLNGRIPASFCLFSVISNKQYNFFTKDQCGKMSCPSSIVRRDSNPQPLKHESSPITTRPGGLSNRFRAGLKNRKSGRILFRFRPRT